MVKEKKYRVLLVDIRCVEGYFYHSLALQLLLGSCLKDNHVEERCEFFLREYAISRFAEGSESYGLEFIADLLHIQPDMVGFSCYVWNYSACLRLASIAKAIYPKTCIVFGGPNVSNQVYAESLISKFPAIDYIIRGEGEESFLQLVKAMIGHRSIFDPMIYGLTYHLNKVARSNCDKNLVSDLNLIPLPYANHQYRVTVKYDPVKSGVMLETYRGCYQKCSYCYWGSSKPNPWSVEIINRELAAILEDEVPRCYIIDSEFSYSLNSTMELLSFIKQNNRKTQFMFFPRLTLIRNREIVRLMKDVGNIEWGFGLQSINPIARNLIHRNWNQTRFEEALAILSEEGIDEYVISLILGLPGDDHRWFKKTIDYVITNFSPKLLHIHHLQVFPGTTLYNEKESYGIVHNEMPPFEVYFNNTYSANDVLLSSRLNQAIGFTYHPARRLTLQLLHLGNFSCPSDFFELVATILDSCNIVRGSYPLSSPESLTKLRSVLILVLQQLSLQYPEVKRYLAILNDLARYESALWCHQHRIDLQNSRGRLGNPEMLDSFLRVCPTRNPSILLEKYLYDVLDITEHTNLENVTKGHFFLAFVPGNLEAILITQVVVDLLQYFNGRTTVEEVLQHMSLDKQYLTLVEDLVSQGLLVIPSEQIDCFHRIEEIVA